MSPCIQEIDEELFDRRGDVSNSLKLTPFGYLCDGFPQVIYVLPGPEDI